jgi:hypothetical protein
MRDRLKAQFEIPLAPFSLQPGPNALAGIDALKFKKFTGEVLTPRDETSKFHSLTVGRERLDFLTVVACEIRIEVKEVFRTTEAPNIKRGLRLKGLFS